jgi:hypothetical protein
MASRAPLKKEKTKKKNSENPSVGIDIDYSHSLEEAAVGSD